MARRDPTQARLDALEEVAARALEYLASAGADHAEASAARGSQLEVNVRMGEVDLVKEASSSGLSVRVIRGERVATSSTNDLGREAVERFCDRVLEMAELAEPDPLAAPPDADELARRTRELDLFDPKSARVSADRAIRIATTAERSALRSSRKISASEGASYSRGVGYSVLATSGGFVGRRAGTSQSIVVHVIADDAEGKKRNGFHWSAARHVEDLERPSEVGREAARRAVARIGARKMPTGVYPVVFDKDAAGGIVGLVASCVLGAAIYRQQSYLAGKIGERVASDKVSLVDDPFVARGMGSRAFDGEGRVARKNAVVTRGRLESYLLDSYSARKLRLDPTGSAAGGGGVPHASTSNFFMRAGRSKPESLLRGVERGLYVTSMMGFGFDPVTGNFSRGAEGFEIVNGELGDPVGEVTVSRNLGELLLGIDAVGRDLELRRATAAPSFRVDAMTVSGQ